MSGPTMPGSFKSGDVLHTLNGEEVEFISEIEVLDKDGNRSIQVRVLGQESCYPLVGTRESFREFQGSVEPSQPRKRKT
ncbi:MAG: hypothetical protein KBC15_00910 [Candidatus Levybacteria bacterium]|nr:hypothetical protein [Candidatus Levybacteria bacterium]